MNTHLGRESIPEAKYSSMYKQTTTTNSGKLKSNNKQIQRTKEEHEQIHMVNWKKEEQVRQ